MYQLYGRGKYADPLVPDSSLVSAETGAGFLGPGQDFLKNYHHGPPAFPYPAGVPWPRVPWLKEAAEARPPASDTLKNIRAEYSGMPAAEPDGSDIPHYMEQMAKSIKKTAVMLDKTETAGFFCHMLTASRIYVAGAGRSGIIARAFALRLLHLGFDVYVVGETITPALRPGDTLVIFSGSGETHTMATFCSTVKGLGGKICLVTAVPGSTLGKMADCVVNLGDLTGYYKKDAETFEKRQVTGQYRSTASAFAPLGTLFETNALVFSDAAISALMVAKKESPGELKCRLTNIE